MSVETETTAPSAEPTSVDGASAASEQTPVVPDPPRDEVERIEPEPVGPIKLENGMEIEIVPLKLRETMKLLKIVTRGAGGALESMMGQLDMDDPAAFAQTFGALILFSIPEAENEAVEFIQSMVLPANFDSLSDNDKIAKLNELAVEMVNPELDDVVTIIERIVRRESEDIRSLGKRIGKSVQDEPQSRRNTRVEKSDAEGLTGGFSRAVHIIETNKGWSTEYVLSLPLCRVRQLIELIIQDKREEIKVHAQLVEWQTRNISSMFASVVRDPKTAKAVEKAVKKMVLPLGDEEADLIDSRSFDEVVEEGALVDLNEQLSFEAMEFALSQI